MSYFNDIMDAPHCSVHFFTIKFPEKWSHNSIGNLKMSRKKSAFRRSSVTQIIADFLKEFPQYKKEDIKYYYS